MDKNKFTNRQVDNVNLKKSKEYLWKYIKSKTALANKKSEDKKYTFFTSLKSLFMPKKLAFVGATAILLIIAVLASTLDLSFFSMKVETVHAAFEMEARNEDSTGVDSNTEFTLKSSEDLDEDTILENLTVEPKVELAVEKTDSGVYTINPKEDLETNSIYTFSINSEIDGKTQEFSWAYQVKDTFKITGTLPGDKTSYIPTNSGIEIYFSHENYDFDSIDNYFEISPKVDGEFEYHYKTLVFVPDETLQPSTIYTVKLNKGLSIKDSDQKLAEDYSFQFETTTDLDYSNTYGVEFTDAFYEVSTTSDIAMEVYNYQYDSYSYIEGEVVPSSDPIIDVAVYSFSGVDSYLEALKERENIPAWAYYTNAFYRYNTSFLDLVGNFNPLIQEVSWIDYIYFPSLELDEGYYLFQINNNGFTSQSLVQITDLSTYIDISETDTLVWVNDVGTGKSIESAKVELLTQGDTFKTNAEGIAVFETPSEWENSYEDKKPELIKITSPEGKILINEVVPYNDYYADYHYWYSFSTDRPMYKGDDTIKFWGFIKPRNSSIDTSDLKIKLVKGWETVVEEVPLTLDENNTFSSEISLSGAIPGYYYLSLYSKDTLIFERYIEVQNYVKPAYGISLDSDKKAVFAGETVNFDINSSYFDGTPVSNLLLQYSDSWSDYVEFNTDLNGDYSLSLKTKKEPCTYVDYCYNSHDFYFNVSSVLAEETNIYEDTYVRVFDSKLNIDSSSEVLDDDIAKVSVKTNWVDLTKLNENLNEYYYDYIGDIAENRTLNAEVTEMYWEKVETGQYYDFINKKTEKTYNYNKVENYYVSFSIDTDGNGEGSFEFDIDPNKYYRVNITGYDDDDNIAYNTVYVYGSDSSSSDYDYYQMKILNGTENEYMQEFDVGDKVETAFANNETPLSKDTDGTFLFLQHSNGLQGYEIKDSPYYNFEFEKDDVPTVYVAGVWFDGKSYTPTYWQTVYYNKDLKKLNIDVITDKDSYKPGDEVTLKVNTTDLNGDGVSSVVNFNLVDEAFYKIAYDYLEDPLDDLYMATSIGELYSYETHNSPLSAMSNGGAEGRGCFAEGTKILMANGEYKNIEDISEGDYISTKEKFFSANLVAAKVLSTISHDVNEYILINDQLKVTKEHILFINGGWKQAINIKIGDYLLDKDGHEVEVVSIKTIKGPVKVYNFTVENQHTYFADDFYVHNEKGGYEVRSDFEDTALFEAIETNSQGIGEITFKLPDNITSWRVTAKAIDTENLQGGVKVASVKVSLPIFADLIMNSEYSVNDSPIVKFRAYGTELEAGDIIDFVLSAKSLGIEESETIKGEAFDGSYYELGNLTKGEHDVTLYMESNGKKDAISKTIDVVGSRLKETVIDIVENVKNGSSLSLPKDEASEVFFIDGGTGKYYYDLLSLYFESGDRLDQKLSGIIASELFDQYFNQTLSPIMEFATQQYQSETDGGLRLLPYSSSDLRLSALVLTAETDVERYSEADLKQYFYGFYKNTQSNLDEIVLSLLGLANLNEPVLTSLKLIQDEEDLTTTDKLYIGLAFSSLGSKIDANKIYQEVSEDLGKKGSSTYDTALGAMLAASLNLNDAEKMWNYVLENGIEDDILNLYAMTYIKNSLQFANKAEIKFEITHGDDTEDVELKPWEVYSVLVLPGEGMNVSDIEGDLTAIVSYEKEISPDQLEVNEGLSIDRTYYVNDVETNEFEEGDLIKVVLSVSADSSIKDEWFSVVDILPSGLTPVSRPYNYLYYYGDYDMYSFPCSIDGQEMRFCWDKIYSRPTIVYYARVVNPGEFYADPAKIESVNHPEIVNISKSDTVKIYPVNN